MPRIQRIDRIILDVSHPFPKVHTRVTGKDNRQHGFIIKREPCYPEGFRITQISGNCLLNAHSDDVVWDVGTEIPEPGDLPLQEVHAILVTDYESVLPQETFDDTAFESVEHEIGRKL